MAELGPVGSEISASVARVELPRRKEEELVSIVGQWGTRLQVANAHPSPQPSEGRPLVLCRAHKGRSLCRSLCMFIPKRACVVR
eukprot:751428-Pelagomonas_calceolata.AAC.1